MAQSKFGVFSVPTFATLRSRTQGSSLEIHTFAMRAPNNSSGPPEGRERRRVMVWVFGALVRDITLTAHMNSGARYCKHCGNCSRQAGGRSGSTFCTTRPIAKHSFRVSSPPTLSSKLAQATASHSTLTSRMQFETYRNPPLQLLLTPLFGSRLLIAKIILFIFFCDQCIR
jgi:hypothetical protein